MAKKPGRPENLQVIQTPEEAREKGRNGGIKSGEVRRRKRDAKAAAKLILQLPCTEAMTTNLANMGVKENDYTNIVAMFARAFVVAMTGDVSAMRFLVDSAGMNPIQMLEEKRFQNELDQQEGGTNIVEDWVNSIPDFVSGEKEDEQEHEGQ